VGGLRLRHFAGTSFEPRKLREKAARTLSRVDAVLGGFSIEHANIRHCKVHWIRNPPNYLNKFE
jgi:hypothetical protein